MPHYLLRWQFKDSTAKNGAAPSVAKCGHDGIAVPVRLIRARLLALCEPAPRT
jgi:hypothetical protein